MLQRVGAGSGPDGMKGIVPDRGEERSRKVEPTMAERFDSGLLLLEEETSQR